MSKPTSRNTWQRCVLALLFVLVPLSVVHAAEEVQMAEYYVGIIYKGANWKPYSAPGAPEIQAAHRANIDKLIASGQMLMAGPFNTDGEMRGLFFYKAASLEEAQKLVDTDPAVIAGQLRVELHPWYGPKALEDVY